MIELDAVYSPQSYEKKIWDFWIEGKYFNADVDAQKTPYTILMPPPNVTSQLHMGHGLGYTIQDLFIRWKRMKGFNVCWLPGTDHAGIATQMMVEKSLEKEGKTRQELGRDAFLKSCHEWRDKYGGIILEQFASMGFSCDWRRVAYTLDPQLSEAVRYVFVKLYEEGLIYRGERLVNWDPVLQTALSDDELENIEVSGHLWYFRYPLADSDEFITIATTRPETMLGDSAVAVNPDDDRYQHLIGKEVRLPFVGRLIPVIADNYVKSEFGTGAVKITPAHDPNDFEIGRRHNLPFVTVINDDASMSADVPERFRGLDRFAARKEIVRAIKELGLFEKEESYKHTVPHSERSKTVIEPKLSHQWYVSMRAMAVEAAEEARSGRLRFHPESWQKTYLYWLDNIQDWCISRQLWWGHRIPIWYCSDCQAITTGVDDQTFCRSCNSSQIVQDEDVLDTWFSSWLWPLSPFGWPPKSADKGRDLAYFYPTDLLVTAPEIIFLWVARMVMAGKKFTGAVPFKDVYFNATVCDKKGRKFSKTLGNGIDPLDVIAKHGADAVRFTAISLAPLGGRVKMGVEDFDIGAKFINKIWNASRFLFRYIDATTKPLPISKLNLHLSEKWLLTELAETAQRMESDLENYRVNDAVEKLYHYIWGSFCDWGLETAKEALASDDVMMKESAVSVLLYCLDGLLRLAHPTMPFVSEELWQKLPHHPDWDRPASLSIARFPEPKEMPSFKGEAETWHQVQQLITEIRSARSQAGISPKEKLVACLRADAELLPVFNETAAWTCRLAGLSEFTVAGDVKNPGRSLTAVGKGFEAYLPVAGLLDVDKERVRLASNLAKLSKALEGIDRKLTSRDFVDRAPEDILLDVKMKKESMEAQRRSIELNLEALK